MAQRLGHECWYPERLGNAPPPLRDSNSHSLPDHPKLCRIQRQFVAHIATATLQIMWIVSGLI